MKSLVRFLIGFVLVYQLTLLANCKVIKQQQGHEKEISGSEANYERSNETTNISATLSDSREELHKTSINYTNTTSASLSGSDIKSLTHIPGRPDQRSFSKKIHGALHGVKRSFKKVFYAWTFYGPEIGLCSCLFKFAWFTYPIVPEVTMAAMGRARRMVSGFMQDFLHGFIEEQSKDHNRISNKVAETTADDYYDYQRKQEFPVYGPFRRVGDHASNLPENVPIVEKLNPQLENVVDMLKNLQPKGNISDFVIRLARHIRSLPRNPNNAQQFYNGDEIRYFTKQHHRDEARADGNATKPSISKVDVIVAGRSSLSSNRMPIAQPNIDRIAHVKGPPPGLPSYNDLPPADYSYYENGIHHHVHDLRKDKRTPAVKGGGWLAFDFEETILQALGLSHPGRSVKPSVVKCSKLYIFNVILRFLQSSFVG